MTANELADWLDKKAIVSFTEYFGEHLELAADMLRQQQTEIEALHNLVKEQQTNYEKGFIDGMNKQMQSRVQQMVDGYAKLRELTEWEIKECWEEATEMREHFCSQYFDFAQLILKKASEK